MRNGFAVGAKTLHRLGKHEVSSRVPSEAMGLCSSARLPYPVQLGQPACLFSQFWRQEVGDKVPGLVSEEAPSHCVLTWCFLCVREERDSSLASLPLLQ